MNNTYSILEKSTIKKAFLGPQGIEIASSKQQFRKLQQSLLKHERLRQAASAESDLSWFVIGKDTELGDLFYVNKHDTEQAVYLGVFNEKLDHWESTLVSTSLVGFVECLALLSQLTEQKEAQFVPTSTSIFDLEKLETMGKELAEISEHVDFWKSFFISYVQWLQDEYV